MRQLEAAGERKIRDLEVSSMAFAGGKSNLHVSPRHGKAKALASDALPLPVGVTNKLFMALFFLASYYLMRRWREKIRTSTPLHMLTLEEQFAVITLISSFIYLIGFFGIEHVQNFINKNSDEDELRSELRNGRQISPREVPRPPAVLLGKPLPENDDEDLANAVSVGSVFSQSLESELGDCERAAMVRRRATELSTGRSFEGLPVQGYDYKSILGQCCEMVVGYVQIPVGVAGPLLLDGFEYTIPMATTEGCLVASTNRGCKAIHRSGGAVSVLLKDGITRAPVVSFSSVKDAAALKFYLEDPNNFDTLSTVFNRSSRFARLQSIRCTVAGHYNYLRFCSTSGDAMGMNMITKGVQNVLDFLHDIFPEMCVVSVSGNLCADKKPTAVNWIEGRGKSVVCEAVIKGEVVSKVLKTSVSALVEAHIAKNYMGSALAGAIGGNNAHAANIVSAVFIATGQDPAQNVESSQCMTIMEATNCGNDLYVAVTMPSIEVGTIGGGTQLGPQSACLNLLGVKGSNPDSPGLNAQTLARVVAGATLAGELSLMAALATGQLVKSHMKYNRSSRNVAEIQQQQLSVLVDQPSGEGLRRRGEPICLAS